VWSQKECDDAFTADMQIFCAAVSSLVKVPLNQNQFDALVSFTYNCGSGALKGSTLLRKLNNGDYDGAAAEFPRWTKGGGVVLPGLVRRRAAEMHLFLSRPSVAFALAPQGMASIVRVT
jgi:lysozyme